MIPHPGLANWILRRGVTESARTALCLHHEFAHFQTLPLMLLFSGGMLTGVSCKSIPSLSGLLFLLIGLQAAWEIMSDFNVPLFTGLSTFYPAELDSAFIFSAFRAAIILNFKRL
jgi:hypothetical protein